MDPVTIARIQFAASISFHILFPSLSIGLAWYLFYFRFSYLRDGDDSWQQLYLFWVAIFALCFALGVVSGITMSFQFGTHWPGFMLTVGNIAGPLLSYEVLSAFFLEASFLGLALYGLRRIGPYWHLLSLFIVAIGTTLSAFWILVLNSWMHTPSGYKIIEGAIHPENWMEIIFNPSMPYRFTHMMLASFISSGMLIAGISAYRAYKGDTKKEVILGIKSAISLLSILLPIQFVVGDLHGLNTLKHQPAKVAAIEGLWETEKGAGLRLFAWPIQNEKKNRLEVTIPYLGSLILTHSWDGEIKGLNTFGENIPKVAPVFFSFRVMVGAGLIMFLVVLCAQYYALFKNYFPKSILLALSGCTFFGWISTLAGWYTTEIGRQPWLVYGLLRTQDAVATNVPLAKMTSTLLIYLLLYALWLISFVVVIYLLAQRAIKRGPHVTA